MTESESHLFLLVRVSQAFHFSNIHEYLRDSAKVKVSPPYTRFRVSDVEPLKSDMAESVVVRQHGYILGNDSEVMEEQPLLELGQTYVLMTNPALEGKLSDYTLIGAPLAAMHTTHSNRGETTHEIREAIRNQQYAGFGEEGELRLRRERGG